MLYNKCKRKMKDGIGNMSIRLNAQYTASFVSAEEYAHIQPQVNAAHEQLVSRTGAGNDFLGWVDLPENYDKEEFARIKLAAYTRLSIHGTAVTTN